MDAGGGTRHLCPVVVTRLVPQHIYKSPPKRITIPSFGTTYLGNRKKRRDKKHVKSIRLVIVHLWPLSDVLIVTGEKRKKKKTQLLSLASLLLSTSSEKHDVLPGLVRSHSLLFSYFGFDRNLSLWLLLRRKLLFPFLSYSLISVLFSNIVRHKCVKSYCIYWPALETDSFVVGYADIITVYSFVRRHLGPLGASGITGNKRKEEKRLSVYRTESDEPRGG